MGKTDEGGGGGGEEKDRDQQISDQSRKSGSKHRGEREENMKVGERPKILAIKKLKTMKLRTLLLN